MTIEESGDDHDDSERREYGEERDTAMAQHGYPCRGESDQQTVGCPSGPHDRRRYPFRLACDTRHLPYPVHAPCSPFARRNDEG